MKAPLDTKSLLEDRWDLMAEFEELLGPSKGHPFTRQCFNKAGHKSGDRNFSLSFDSKTSAWACHGANCGEKGDLYSLYMKIRGWTFAQTMVHLLHKYHLEQYTRLQKQDFSYGSESFPWQPIDQAARERFMQTLMGGGGWDPVKLAFMAIRYGLTERTIKQWLLVYSRKSRRVEIPIPMLADESDRMANSQPGVGTQHKLPALANVRGHDVFRYHCDWCFNDPNNPVSVRQKPDEVDIMNQEFMGWTPSWPKERGKVVSLKGHGTHYLYPIGSLINAKPDEVVYLVGGEFKALLLLQLGIRAVSFTGGEGGLSKRLIGMFVGKRIRILLDPDERHREKRRDLETAKLLASAGAEVERGEWNPEIERVDGWPHKGDVTDLLRLSNWNPAILEDDLFLEWIKCDRETLTFDPNRKLSVESSGPGGPIEVRQVGFEGLTTPAFLDSWVEVDALISGVGDVPFAVPKKVDYYCARGMTDFQPKCQNCGLTQRGFRARVEYSVEEQIDFVGVPASEADNRIRNRIGIPKGCKDPKIERLNLAIDKVVLCPSIHTGESIEEDPEGSINFSRRPAYLLFESHPNYDQNSQYRFLGKVLTDPRKGHYTFAATRIEASSSDVFNWKPKKEMDELLIPVVQRGVGALVADLRDNVCKIFASDTMILGQTLAWFLPFRFKLGPFDQERICPMINVVGDTLTGKTTVYKRLMTHFGVGRYATGDADPTTVGLIGGYTGTDQVKSFSWGLLPTTHRAIIGLDEWHKVGDKVISSLANLVSSGIAQRTAGGMDHKTKCHVRMVTFSNPGSGRPLDSYSQKLQVVYETFKRQENVGRLEYVIVQPKPPPDMFSDPTLGLHPCEQHYVPDLARYHLGWAWSLTPGKIHFEDPAYVAYVAAALSSRFGNHDLLLATASRFKLARVAAGFASMLFSHDEKYHLIVTKEHVDMAVAFFHQIYDPYLLSSKGATTTNSMGLLPEPLIGFFNRIPHPFWKRLSLLAGMHAGVSAQDLQKAMGGAAGFAQFLDLAQFSRERLITLKGANYYPVMPTFCEDMDRYLILRARVEADRVDAIDPNYDPNYGDEDLDGRVGR